MKRLLVIVGIIFTAANAFAQSAFVHYFSAGNDTRISLTDGHYTKDGEYVIAGSRIYEAKLVNGIIVPGDQDMYIAKTNSTGNIIWERTLGGSSVDGGVAIIESVDGGIVLVGSTSSFGAGGSDMYLVKFSANGNLLFSRTYGSIGGEYATDVYETADHGFIISGRSNRYNGTSTTELLIVKADSNGNIKWSRVYGQDGALTGVNGYPSKSIAATANNGYVIAGEFRAGASPSNMYLLNIDSVGNQVWSATYGNAGDDAALSIKATPDSGFIVCGKTYLNAGSLGDIYIVKTTASGALQWSKSYGSVNNEIAFDINVLPGVGYMVAGEQANAGNGFTDAFLMKISESGNLLWSKSYGDSIADETANTLFKTNDGGLALITSSNIGSLSNGLGSLIIKTDSIGYVPCYFNPYIITTSTGGTKGSLVLYDSVGPNMTVCVSEIFNYQNKDSSICSLINLQNVKYPNPIEVFPNPASDAVLVNVGFPLHNAKVVITNTAGQQVLTLNNVSGTQVYLSLAALPDGIFTLNILDATLSFKSTRVLHIK
jgi:Secretion system C-terminal sorting domain